jgi:hypothetical protein
LPARCHYGTDHGRANAQKRQYDNTAERGAHA